MWTDTAKAVVWLLALSVGGSVLLLWRLHGV